MPLVTTVHGFTGGGLRNRSYEALQRLAFRRFNAVVAVSRPLAELLRASGIPANRVHVVPNALAPQPSPLARDAARRALGLPNDAFIAGWVGRMSPEKSLGTFVSAIASLQDADISAAILGDGVERRLQERRSRELATAQFFWCGEVRSAASYFAAFDVLVLSSRTEGLPMVLLEAMAARVPIVSTAVGGIPDLLSAAEALLVPPDAPSALAAAIRSVRTDPVSAATRTRAAQLRQQSHFTVQCLNDRYIEIYRGVLEDRSTAAGHA